ncbi:CLCA1-like protein, partial [Mya arenaria]
KSSLPHQDCCVYFGEINIVVPRSWTPQGDAQPVQQSERGYFKIEDGQLITTRIFGNDLCGQGGTYTYLPLSFVKNTSRTDFGKHENVLVHEWAQLRWGVFPEYGTDEEAKATCRVELCTLSLAHVVILTSFHFSCSENVQGRVGFFTDFKAAVGTSKAEWGFVLTLSLVRGMILTSFHFSCSGNVQDRVGFCTDCLVHGLLPTAFQFVGALTLIYFHFSCSENVQGRVGIGTNCKASSWCDTNDSTRRIHPGCRFCPDLTQSVTGASIMDNQFVDLLDLFCDDSEGTPAAKRHNRLATNKQNLYCDHKIHSERLPEGTDTTPVYTILQEAKSRKVFVLDKSGSLEWDTPMRIVRLHETGKYILENEEEICADSYLGIVDSEATRAALVDALPTIPAGGTCIGCGLKLAIDKGTYFVVVKTKPDIAINWEYDVKSKSKDNHQVTVTTRFSDDVVYTDVLKGNAPVLNANVVATSGSCFVILRDNGIGKDITAGDGTYTGQLTCPKEGRSETRVTVKANSIIIVTGIVGAATLNPEAFEEIVIEESFERFSLVEDANLSPTTIGDTTSPGKITDLRIEDVETNGNTRHFTIRWTATGDDSYNGQATTYQLRYANDLDSLLNNFGNAQALDIGQHNLYPRDSGEDEAVDISVTAEKEFNETAFLGIRALDEVGNGGAMSNIVSIVIANGKYDGFNISFNGRTNHTYSPPPPIKDDDKTNMGLIIGVVIGTAVPKPATIRHSLKAIEHITIKHKLHTSTRDTEVMVKWWFINVI